MNFLIETTMMVVVARTEWRIILYLIVENISIEDVENERREAKKLAKVGIGDGVLETMKGMHFWMRKEVKELQRKNTRIKDSIEQV